MLSVSSTGGGLPKACRSRTHTPAHLDAAVSLQDSHRFLKLLLLLRGHTAPAAALHILDGVEHRLLRALQLQGNMLWSGSSAGKLALCSRQQPSILHWNQWCSAPTATCLAVELDELDCAGLGPGGHCRSGRNRRNRPAAARLALAAQHSHSVLPRRPSAAFYGAALRLDHGQRRHGVQESKLEQLRLCTRTRGSPTVLNATVYEQR